MIHSVSLNAKTHYERRKKSRTSILSGVSPPTPFLQDDHPPLDFYLSAATGTANVWLQKSSRPLKDTKMAARTSPPTNTAIGRPMFDSLVWGWENFSSFSRVRTVSMVWLPSDPVANVRTERHCCEKRQQMYTNLIFFIQS
jgi:hypothetical protein